MAYFTSIIKVKTKNFLKIIDQEWTDKEPPKDAEKLLGKLFPYASIPTYDIYFRFPKGSLVWIKKSARNEFIIDCLAERRSSCLADFSVLLRRLSEISKYTIDSVDFEFTPPTKKGILLRILVPGGLFLTLIPILGEIIHNNRGIFYTVTILLFILCAYWYYRRPTE